MNSTTEWTISWDCRILLQARCLLYHCPPSSNERWSKQLQIISTANVPYAGDTGVWMTGSVSYEVLDDCGRDGNTFSLMACFNQRCNMHHSHRHNHHHLHHWRLSLAAMCCLDQQSYSIQCPVRT